MACNDPNCACKLLDGMASEMRDNPTSMDLFRSATAHLAYTILHEMLTVATEAEAEAIMAVCTRTETVRFEIPPSPLVSQVLATLEQGMADVKPDTERFVGLLQRSSQMQELISHMAPPPEAKA